MEVWVIWLIVAVVLVVAEILTLTAALGLLGAAALITAVVAAAGLSLAGQLTVFAIASTAGLLLLRPIAPRHRLPPPRQRFGIEALIGKSAYVIQEVTGHEGRVRIGGEEWTARCYDETLVIPPGATVDIMQIEGATAIVYPRE
jgi:membrane protein implicated in regulation of membrane protease activity